MPKSKSILKLFLLLAVFPLCCATANAQLDRWPQVYCSSTSPSSLRADVEALCSAEFGGRATGDSTSALVQSFLIDRFVDAGLEPFGGTWGHAVELKDGRKGCNVVGCLPGTSGKWIVVAANYDGLGIVGEKLYPGADANASGVAALIAIASSVARGTKDGIIFAALDAKSSDYSGARALLKEVGKKKIRMMVCLDTVGSTLEPVERRHKQFMIALGGERWSKTLEPAAALEPVKLYYDYYRSARFTELFYRKIGDQRVFLEAGIPSVVFTSGVTRNVNKTTDTPETLDYEVLRARVLCITRWISTISSSR